MRPVIGREVILARSRFSNGIDIILTCDIQIDPLEVVGRGNSNGDVSLLSKVLLHLPIGLELAASQGRDKNRLTTSAGDFLGELQEIRFVLVDSYTGSLFLVVVAELSALVSPIVPQQSIKITCMVV